MVIMDKLNELIEGLVFTNPSILPTIINNYEAVGKYYLPASIGIEIESHLPQNNFSKFTNEIRKFNLLDFSYWESEQQFRIREGYKGLVELYNVLEVFKELVQLNPLSGIHFHVDLTKYWDNLDRELFIEQKGEDVLKDLDSWNYIGTYNQREFRNRKGGWIGFREVYKTAECRIMEMTYDYTLLAKRIHNLCYILIPRIQQFTEYNALIEEYEELKKVEVEENNLLDNSLEIIALNTIKNRKIKL